MYRFIVSCTPIGLPWQFVNRLNASHCPEQSTQWVLKRPSGLSVDYTDFSWMHSLINTFPIFSHSVETISCCLRVLFIYLVTTRCAPTAARLPVACLISQWSCNLLADDPVSHTYRTPVFHTFTLDVIVVMWPLNLIFFLHSLCSCNISLTALCVWSSRTLT